MNSSQTTLDNFVQPAWTQEGLLGHIIELLVTADLVRKVLPLLYYYDLDLLQPFQLVERQSFRGILKFMYPGIKESNIPHCTKITQAIQEHAAIVQERLHEEMQVSSVHLSLLGKTCMLTFLRIFLARSLLHLIPGHLFL